MNIPVKNQNNTNNISSLMKFIFLSSIGIFLFMIPLSINDKIVIPVATLSNWLQSAMSGILIYILIGITVITAVFSILCKLFKPEFIKRNSFLNSLFDVSTVWLVIRIAGAIFLISTVFEVGPEAIWSENTGGMVVADLLPVLFSVFLFAGMFLPLLLDFGLLEFAGSMLSKVMGPVFNLPGSAAIDCIASWLGDGTIGVLLTSRQYEKGYYSEREACVIGTTFSLVSITFSLVVIDKVGLSHMFVPFYLTVTLASLLAAVIVPKLPPLSNRKDVYYNNKKNSIQNDNSDSGSSFKRGISAAIKKAESSSFKKDVLIKGSKNVIDMWFAVIPVVMAIGTFALIIAEYTPIFKILGTPFIPILNLLQIPEATAASSTIVAGFVDMLLPSLMAASIESDMTRFIIAATSVTQLIYLSEVGALLLGSKIPLNLKDLFIIFIERTLITLPIISIVAHFIF